MTRTVSVRPDRKVTAATVERLDGGRYAVVATVYRGGVEDDVVLLMYEGYDPKLDTLAPAATALREYVEAL